MLSSREEHCQTIRVQTRSPSEPRLRVRPTSPQRMPRATTHRDPCKPCLFIKGATIPANLARSEPPPHRYPWTLQRSVSWTLRQHNSRWAHNRRILQRSIPHVLRPLTTIPQLAFWVCWLLPSPDLHSTLPASHSTVLPTASSWTKHSTGIRGPRPASRVPAPAVARHHTAHATPCRAEQRCPVALPLLAPLTGCR